jgi:hypothetical protein
MDNVVDITNRIGDDRLSLTWGNDGKPRQASVKCMPADQDAAEQAAAECQNLPCYETHPEEFEEQAISICQKHLAPVVAAATIAADRQFPLVTVSGLPSPGPNVVTPSNGYVDEQSIRSQVAFLVGILGPAFDFGGFAYASENKSLLLRGVAPVRNQIGKATSQGWDADLGMHNDNACHWMIHERTISGAAPFMNPVQAFAAIRSSDAVPMEVLCLDDVLADLTAGFGVDAVTPLACSEFAVRWPDSHDRDGEIAISDVPLLVRDAFGNWNSRFHMANVIGLTERANEAFGRLKAVIEATEAIREIQSHPGDLIAYSNTRTMHRRRAYTPKFDGTDRYYVRLYLAPRRLLTGGRVREA